jgi:hypothetical protein
VDLNFPVFATGVRIFRDSNEFWSWVHTNTRNKHKVSNKMAGYCYISYHCRFPWFLKNKRMECTNLVDPHQLLCSWFTVVFVLFCIYGSLSKYTHFFMFIFWWHQIFTFPFCFSLLVFPTLQWHIHIICSRENHHENKYSRYVTLPHTFQSVVLPT